VLAAASSRPRRPQLHPPLPQARTEPIPAVRVSLPPDGLGGPSPARTDETVSPTRSGPAAMSWRQLGIAPGLARLRHREPRPSLCPGQASCAIGSSITSRWLSILLARRRTILRVTEQSNQRGPNGGTGPYMGASNDTLPTPGSIRAPSRRLRCGIAAALPGRALDPPGTYAPTRPGRSRRSIAFL
jgi:hypothetical protein